MSHTRCQSSASVFHALPSLRFYFPKKSPKPSCLILRLKMTLKRRSFFVAIAVLLLIAASSFAETEVEEKDDAASNDKVPVGSDTGPIGEAYGELPEFQEGVTVKVIKRHDTCYFKAAKGNWLQVNFVAKQMNDDGDAYEEFDSTESRHKQLSIQVEDRNKLPGLSEGLREVCAGEEREITIQAESPLMKVDPKFGLIQPKMDRAAIYEVTVTAILVGEPVNIFARMDANSDNNLSRDEVKDYFQVGHGGKEEAEENADKLFSYQDKDLDDIISFDEFQGPKYAHDEF